MQWYGISKTAAKPPAYLVERISDLNYACDLSQTAPSTARSVLNGVIVQLQEQMDHEYVDDLVTASDMMIDNPQKARNLIGLVASFMQADKDKHDLEKKYPWTRRKLRP